MRELSIEEVRELLAVWPDGADERLDAIVLRHLERPRSTRDRHTIVTSP